VLGPCFLLGVAADRAAQAWCWAEVRRGDCSRALFIATQFAWDPALPLPTYLHSGRCAAWGGGYRCSACDPTEYLSERGWPTGNGAVKICSIAASFVVQVRDRRSCLALGRLKRDTIPKLAINLLRPQTSALQARQLLCSVSALVRTIRGPRLQHAEPCSNFKTRKL